MLFLCDLHCDEQVILHFFFERWKPKRWKHSLDLIYNVLFHIQLLEAWIHLVFWFQYYLRYHGWVFKICNLSPMPATRNSLKSYAHWPFQPPFAFSESWDVQVKRSISNLPYVICESVLGKLHLKTRLLERIWVQSVFWGWVNFYKRKDGYVYV